ncbi:MAG TPA: hypothetical protein VLX29_09250 [Nitrospirota bacterium]|nr:hypothetical protein [Nitrospirota bacterium]
MARALPVHRFPGSAWLRLPVGRGNYGVVLHPLGCGFNMPVARFGPLRIPMSYVKGSP